MLQKIDILGVHTEVDDNLRKYVMKKIGGIDRYLSRPSKKAAHVEVRLKEGKAKDKKQCTCEVTLHVPQGTLVVQESTLNMYAAVDIVEAKLKHRIKKYKESHSNKFRRRLFARFNRKMA